MTELQEFFTLTSTLVFLLYSLFMVGFVLPGSRGSLTEWEQSKVELLLPPAPAAEQPELRSQGSARGGALCLKEGGDEEVTALSMRLLVCADRCPPPHCQLEC